MAKHKLMAIEGLKTKPPETGKRDAPRRGKAVDEVEAIEVAVGLDPGNAVSVVLMGIIKPEDQISIPSAIFTMPVTNRNESGRAYLGCEARPPRTEKDGTGATLLIGDEIVYVGTSAIAAGGTLARWTGNDPSRNKPAFARYFLLSALACRYPSARKIHATLYANVHQESLVDQTKKNLMGIHRFSILDSSISGEVVSREVEIEVLVDRILPEECGAMVNASYISFDGNTPVVRPGSPVAVIGIGGRTANVAAFQGSKAMLSPQVIGVGGFDLITEIARQQSLIRRIQARNYDIIGAADFELVKRGIEDGSFVYGRTGVSFRGEFESLLSPVLVNPVIEHAKNSLKALLNNVENVLITGGCSMMPGVVDLISDAFPNPYENKQYVVTTEMGNIDNAAGLYRLARSVRDKRLAAGK